MADASNFDPVFAKASDAVIRHMDGLDSGAYLANDSNTGTVSAIDPALILTIIQTIISVIQSCKFASADDLRRKAANPGLLGRLVVNRAAAASVRENFGRRSDLGWAEFNAIRDEIVHGVLTAGSEGDPADIEEIRAAALKPRDASE